MGLMVFDIERRGGCCETQMESRNSLTKLEGGRRVSRCASLGEKWDELRGLLWVSGDKGQEENNFNAVRSVKGKRGWFFISDIKIAQQIWYYLIEDTFLYCTVNFHYDTISRQ